MKSVFNTLFLLLLSGFAAQAQIEKSNALVTAVTVSSVSPATGSFAPLLSADGNSIVFVSLAKEHVAKANEPTPYLDVFHSDRASLTSRLVSALPFGPSTSGNANSGYPNVSTNGQLVAFESAATDLLPGVTNGFTQIFLRNTFTVTTTLVSQDTNGTSPGNGNSFNAALSSDGRYVVFESTASNLVATPLNTSSNIYRRDLQSAVTEMVSINAAGDRSGNEVSGSPSITSDARWIAFLSKATNLVVGVTNLGGDIYLRDMDTATTVWVSRGVTNYLPGPFGCLNPEISADGRYVVFGVTNNTFSPSQIFRYDRVNDTLLRVATDAALLCPPGLSADGRFVSWYTVSNAWVRDTQLETNILLTVGWTRSGSSSNALFSTRPVLSPTGNQVAFLGVLSNSPLQLFTRTLPNGTNLILSLNRFGAPGSDLSGILPAWNWNGTALVFESPDPNMAPNDFNGDSDIFYRDLASSTNVLISRVNSPSDTAPRLNVLAPVPLSQDSRFVLVGCSDTAWTSTAVVDTNEFMDLFVMDLVSKTNLPVSIASGTNLMTGADPYSAALSADGRYAVFVSTSGTAAPGVGKGATNIFRRDLQQGTTSLVSANRFGTNAGNSSSLSPSMSADGQWIAFESSASDLLTTNLFSSGPNVFVRDMLLGSNTLVSASVSGTVAGYAPSVGPVISPDGRWIAFLSKAGNLVTNTSQQSTTYQLFLRDRLNQVTRLVSQTPAGNPFTLECFRPVFSPQGGTLVFASGGSLYWHDVAQDTTAPVCGDCSNPSLSRDGAMVTYEAVLGGTRQIKVQNLFTGLSTLVSVDSSGTASGDQNSASPVLSHDGRYVVFASRATNLVANDTNGWSDIFLRDLRTGTTLLVSANFSGMPGDGPSSKPIVGPDGRTFLFQSFASNLRRADRNQARDLFLFSLSTEDTDTDGMEDSWEVAYFGNLSHDGTADTDTDGQTDLSEFKAGTNPTNDSSVFSVLSLIAAGSNQRTLFWTSVPGKTYRVQYKDSFNNPKWTALPGDITSQSTSASKMDPEPTSSSRFYRVLVLP